MPPVTMRSQPDDASKGRVLVIEDERQIARFIELELLHDGYDVTVAPDGVAALVEARQHPPDLVVLDVMIPGIDGLEVCRRLRSASGASAGTPPDPGLPIIMVTAKDSVPDRVAGLKAGADDYLTKPFSIEELLARVEALLRRSGRGRAGADREVWLRMADLVVNTTTREVRRGRQGIELTTKEYELLVYLLRHPRQVLSREQIYEAVWGYDFAGESNVLDVYIRYLRNKVDRHGPPLIHTVRGVGYVMKET